MMTIKLTSEVGKITSDVQLELHTRYVDKTLPFDVAFIQCLNDQYITLVKKAESAESYTDLGNKITCYDQAASIIFDAWENRKKMWVKTKGKDNIMYKEVFKRLKNVDTLYDADLNEYLPIENPIVLKDGTLLDNQYGKYQPNLSILIDPSVQMIWKKDKDFNLGVSSIDYVQGDYFISKKGTKCFRINPQGKHLLLRDDWGGCFNSYRGHTLSEDNLYYRRASSNGGGTGYDYAIVLADYKQELTIDDI